MNVPDLSRVQWRKSSRSSANGACVEVAVVAAHESHGSRAPWRASSYSGGTGGNCVEVAPHGAAVAVRDSKDPDGPKLVFSPAAWRAFADRLTAEGFGQD